MEFKNKYLVKPLVFNNDRCWGVSQDIFLNPDLKIKYIGNNIRKIEELEDGTLKARQLSRGIEVLGGMNEEIKREFIAPIEERNEF